MGWGPLLLAIISLVGVMVKTWQDCAPNRAEGAKNAETAKDRKAIASGNVAAVNLLVDSMQPVQTAAASNPSGLSNDSDTARELAAITGI